MRLIVLGDSGAAGEHSWPTKLSNKLNCELINFAKPASQILLQIQLMQDWLIENDLTDDDIIIWQVGWSLHPLVHIGYDHLDSVKKADRFVTNKMFISHYHLRDNKIDNNKRISLLPISPVLHKFSNRKKPNDEAEVLHQMLCMSVILKKLCSRILITKTKNDHMKGEYWENLKKVLIQKNIDFINDSMCDWCIDENLEMQFYHPTEESYDIYTNKVLIPKLKDLGWI